MKHALIVREEVSFLERMNVAVAELNNIAREFLMNKKNKVRLTLPQFFVLNHSARKSHGLDSGIKMADLAAHMQVTGANITCIVDNLEKKRLVKRNYSPNDRRVINISVTDYGMDVLLELRSKLAGYLSENVKFGVVNEIQKACEESLDIY